uniref:Uncharacterized protein n=1 Tax=viral metagenome TaxID=1070528 RepID=A0A6C0EUN8_9ZZZZ
MFALRKTGLLEKRAAADASAIADANDTDYQKKLQELAKESAEKKEDYDRRQAELQGNAMIVQDSNAFATGGKRKMRRSKKSRKSKKYKRSKLSRKSKKSRKLLH